MRRYPLGWIRLNGTANSLAGVVYGDLVLAELIKNIEVEALLHWGIAERVELALLAKVLDALAGLRRRRDESELSALGLRVDGLQGT